MAEEIKAGAYPAELLAACALEKVEPGALLDWAVTAREVRLILPSGAKVKHPLGGAWAQLKPPAEKSQPGKGK